MCHLRRCDLCDFILFFFFFLSCLLFFCLSLESHSDPDRCQLGNKSELLLSKSAAEAKTLRKQKTCKDTSGAGSSATACRKQLQDSGKEEKKTEKHCCVPFALGTHFPSCSPRRKWQTEHSPMRGFQLGQTLRSVLTETLLPGAAATDTDSTYFFSNANASSFNN